MKWDYENNLPIEGTYKHREYDKDALKSYMNEHFPYLYCHEIHAALESVNWNLEDLFLKKADKEIQYGFHISILVDWKDDLKDYWFDLANGYWNVENDETDIYRRLFFCETEEDIWDLVTDLPQKVTRELLECYQGTREIEYLPPVYLKDSTKAQKMIEYINSKTMENNKLIKKGCILGTTAHYEHRGQIVELTPERISVQLDSPFTMVFCREILEKYRNEVTYAIEIGGEYYATEKGFNMAMDLLIGLSEEEEILLDQPYRLADVIKEYRERVNEGMSLFEKTKTLIEIQEKHFPELKETVISEEMIGEFQKYLTEVEGIEDIYSM